jgi:hypothetical protein
MVEVKLIALIFYREYPPKQVKQPFLVLGVGYPAEGATVPDIAKKPLREISTFV